jgi:fluoride exporter
MKAMLLVMSGGAAGAAMRYGLSRAMPFAADGWPWPTFVANVAGGCAMGFLAVLVLGGDWAEELRLLLGVGLLGGFTTFSAFSFETAQMIERGAMGTAPAYALSSVILALGGLFTGMIVGRLIFA